MRRSFLAYLYDIEVSCMTAQQHMAGLELKDYEASTLIQDAVVRRLELISEAVAQCRLHFPEESALIPDANKIVGLRNGLIHQYFRIKDEIVFEIVRNEVPELLAQIRHTASLSGGRY